MAFALKLGTWDFSIGAAVLFSSIVGGQLANRLGLGVAGVIVLCSICGLAVGSLTGAAFRILRIPSVIVTVGMMLILESVSAIVFGGQGVIMSGEILQIGRFPLNVVIGLLIFGFAYLLYSRMTLGFRVRAVGNSIGIAKLNGIAVDRVRLNGFMLTGLFAGFYAFMTLGTTGVAKPVTNMQTLGIVFDAIICVFIALALEKYLNLMIGVYVGSVCTQIIKVGILALGLPGLFQQAIVACFLLIVMAFSYKGEEMQRWVRRVRTRTAPGLARV